MIFGLALNLHDDVPPNVRWFAQTLILGATLVVVALLGGPLLRTTWQELRRCRLTIEALFLLTLTGAMAASLQAYTTGHGKIYFEVVSVLLVVYTLGKLIGARSRAAAMAGARAWGNQLSTCRLIDTRGRSSAVLVTEVLAGDVVEVNPGETVAVDGVIRDGVGFMSEAAVSGVPFAVVRRPGDRVLAGAVSHDATFHIEATAKGTERQVDRLLTVVEAARDRPVSLQGQADRLGRVFFPIVVFTALATFVYWSFFTSAGWEAALFNAMSVLLVACPCVIGLATPIVIWSAIGRLAERGLIVQAGDVVERLAEVDRLMIDKTGTLTSDSFTILDIATTATGDARAEFLGWLSLIEERSTHPVARAFARLPRPFSPETEPRVRTLNVVPGRGVEAKIEANGVQSTIQIGTPGWITEMTSRGGKFPERRADTEQFPTMLANSLRATGHRIDVALDGRLAAVAVLAEQLRDSSPQALAEFRRLGLSVEVLTGDTAERAAVLHLPPTRATLLPADKHAAVEAARAEGGKPLFVGDGINDAAALVAADCGIALASGADLAVGASDATLYHDDLRVIPWAIELSRDALRLVRRNLHRALTYNAIGMALAACGVLHPVVAVLLMVVSSMCLIFSSTRVGVGRSHCAADSPPVVGRLVGPRVPARQAIGHGGALGLQGVVALLLLASLREMPVAALVLGCFAVGGVGLGYVWTRWTAMPHTVEMCIGMLTLGNLGMLLGWWADNGFLPLHSDCCECIQALHEGVTKPWMWIGMLVGANIAMLLLCRRPTRPSGDHTLAMYTGGNLGMVVGMLAGGWCAAQFGSVSVISAAVVGFAGMTAGMLAGMLVGTWAAEQLLHGARALRWVGQRRIREGVEPSQARSASKG